ncbi:MAG TPA: amidase [Acidimicrobiales bacterium]|nr:amidase [Acidimicrobiales bacterium]
MAGDELLDEDAHVQAAAVRRGIVAPTELVSAAIARIERENPSINAVVIPLFDRALARAAAPLHGPFAGVPMLLKDAGQEIAGEHHWVGTPVLHRAGHRSAATTALVERFESLGFVIVGKTNVPELSAGGTTEPEELGPTHNPWRHGFTAGGSSGGSAAAVAARWVAVAHGSDGSGSLRFPASACGTVTLKPSRGVVPSIPAAGQEDPSRLWTELALTRTTRDLAAVFHGLAEGAEPGVAPTRLRIGVLIDDVATGLPTHPECAAATLGLGALLERLGHHVEESHPKALGHVFRSGGAHAFEVASLAARGSQLRWLEARIGRGLRDGDLSAEALDAGRRGLALSTDAVGQARAVLDDAFAPIPEWWNAFDVLLTPAMRTPPWPLGTKPEGPLIGGFAFAFSFTGQPAVVVPAAVSEGGVPLGVQLVGRAGDDDVLLALASELEDALQWPVRRPAMT